MSAFFNWRGREAQVEEEENARNIWDRRERGASPPPVVEADGRRWIERVAARIGFESFERGFFTLVGGVVLAGSVIAIGAGLTGPTPDEEASGTPAVLVARQEHGDAEATQPAKDSVKAEAVKAEPARAQEPTQEAAAPAAETLAPVTSMLSQTPMRESAREALAQAAPATEEKAKPTEAQALSYAAAPEAAEPAAGSADAAQEEKGAATDAPKGADKAADAKALQPGEQTSRCFVKVGGRVLTSGANCRVSRKGQTLSLAFGSSGVAISPHKGREWTLTVAGRNVGKVYKSGSCWGSNHHTWICEKGV